MNDINTNPAPPTLDLADEGSWPIWLTCQEVAEVLRLNLSTVRLMYQSGRLRARKFGKQVRIHKADLHEFRLQGPRQ